MRTATGCESATLQRAAAVLAVAVMTIALGSPALADPFTRALGRRGQTGRSSIARPERPSAAVVECPTCDPIDTLHVENFSRPDRIDGPWLPLVPGTELVLQGVANRGGGLLPHTVTFTVTNLRKKIGGLPCVVVWDRDINEGELQEAELSFWAQDDFGNVWNTAEYPEEYIQGILIGAENTWVHGLEGAEAGVHIVPRPRLGTPGYREGIALENDFWDCGQVFAKSKSSAGDEDDDGDGHRGRGKGKDGERDGDRAKAPPVCVPAGCYKNWVIIREWAPLDGCAVIQLKTYARGVGIVQVGAVDDPEGETLTLASVRALNAAELAYADSAALAEDARGYYVNDKYALTEPAYLVPARHRKHDKDDDDDKAQIAGSVDMAPLHVAMRIGPNPISNSTAIDYTVTRAGMVELSIYDVAGRKLRALVKENSTPGAYRVLWDGRDDAGRALTAGVYFAKLRTPAQAIGKAVVIAR